MQIITRSTNSTLVFTLKEKLAVGLSAPIWVPIGLVIGLFALPAAGILTMNRQRKEKKQLQLIKANLEGYMSECTAAILDETIGSTMIADAVRGKLRELTDVFEIQDEISTAILEQLKLHLLDGVDHFMFVDTDPRVAATLHSWLEKYFPIAQS